MIKTYILLIITPCILLSNSVSAQEKKNSPFWFPERYSTKDFPRIGISIGTTLYNSFSKDLWINNTRQSINSQIGINIDYYKMGISFQRNNRFRIAQKLPFNYRLPQSEKSALPDWPLDQLQERTITIRRNFYTRYRGLHFVAQAGLTFNTINSADNFLPQQPFTGGLFGREQPNYTYSLKATKDLGLHLKGGANLPLAPGFGFYANFATTLVSAHSNYWAIEAGIIAGYVRKKTKSNRT